MADSPSQQCPVRPRCQLRQCRQPRCPERRQCAGFYSGPAVRCSAPVLLSLLLTWQTGGIRRLLVRHLLTTARPTRASLSSNLRLSPRAAPSHPPLPRRKSSERQSVFCHKCAASIPTTSLHSYVPMFILSFWNSVTTSLLHLILFTSSSLSHLATVFLRHPLFSPGVPVVVEGKCVR